MKAVLVAAFLIIAEQIAFAFQEPDNFRGIKWGSSPEQVTKIITQQLREKGNDWEKVTDLGNGTLIVSDTFGSIYTGPGYDDIPVTFILNFVDNKFAAQLGFKPEDFTRIEEIFVKRYGRPTRAKDTEMQNARGAKFINREVEWLGKKVTIRLVKYAGSITSGGGFIGQQSWLDHRAQQSRKRTSDAARALILRDGSFVVELGSRLRLRRRHEPVYPASELILPDDFASFINSGRNCARTLACRVLKALQ